MSGDIRRSWAALLGILALLGCAPREDRSGLVRRAISPAEQSGWARLPLDGEAQRAWPQIWIGDAQGRSIPFEVAREGLWAPRELELTQVLMGRYARQHTGETEPKRRGEWIHLDVDRPSVEFSLKFPEGWQVREREQLHLDLDLEGQAPWVCGVEVERRLEGGAFLRLEGQSLAHLYDLGASGRRCDLTVPWEAQDYRITLHPSQGLAPRIRGLKVTARTQPEALQADAVLHPALKPVTRPAGLASPGLSGEVGGTWRLELPQAERIVGADVVVAPPLAPVQPLFRIPEDREHGRGAFLDTRGLVWNLPALGTMSTRISLGPVVAPSLEMSLPAGVQPERVSLLVRREVLIFPAEAGQRYYLHQGGRVQRAPGALGILPDSSRTLYGRKPLSLAPGEADPQGLPRLVEPAEGLRAWMPWIAGLVVALLGAAAWRMFRPAAGSGRDVP